MSVIENLIRDFVATFEKRDVDLLHGLLCDRLLQAATDIIGAGIGWNPLRGENLAACGWGRGDGQYGTDTKAVIAVAVNDELERRVWTRPTGSTPS